ncbi:MAG TPA: hypothetical protein VFX06_00945 [Stellaceae bacterium]|nr:hypothetical protein [Stellaceae bacterium]
MKIATLLAGVFIVGLVLPAAAQTEDYYVVQNVKTKTCTVTHQKPATSEYTMVGPDGTIYKTKVEAENAMKTTKVCHSD